ncbi:MAG: ribosome biogenesis GTPase Der, partial [Rhizobiales bacterium]|nr:ribosome biogenesis GTPase Der [Hyphomicrobiales bacterium]
RVFDTAGLRRKARVEGKLEKLAVGDALRAIRFAEVVVLTLDATIPFEKQYLQIADLIESEGRAIVIALDKWDLIEDRQAKIKELRATADHLLPQIRGVKLVPVSGLTGEGIDRLAQAIVAAHEVWNRRLPTAQLNRWFGGIVEHHPPPAVSGRRIKIRYLTQAKSRPPSFVAFCSRPEALPDSWKRYLVNALRDDFKLPGTPIRLLLRKGENPFEGKERKKG